MKIRYACVAVLVLAALPNTRVMAQRRGPDHGDQREAGQQRWLSSLDEGLTEARETGKPLMVVIRCVP